MIDTNRNGKEIQLLAVLAERLRRNPQFMAHVLSTYQQRMGLDDESLAAELGTTPEMVVRLALCKRPDVKSPSFDGDLRELCGYTLADEDALSQVIRLCGSVDGSGVPLRSKTLFGGRPSLVWAFSTEPVVSALPRRALIVACLLTLLSVVSGVILWRQSLQVSGPVLAARYSDVDLPPADSSKASPSSVTPNASYPRVASNSSRNRIRGRVVASRQQPTSKTMTVNLDGRSTLREAGEAAAQGETIIKLPPSRTTLLLRLATGSRRGDYSVSIVDAFAEPVFSTRQSISRGSTLRAPIDIRGIKPGEYRLCVRRESKEQEVPDCFPLLILPSRTDADKRR